MTLLRHRHDISHIVAVNAFNSYKHLNSFMISFDNGNVLDVRQLSLHVDELQYTKATGDIASLG